MGWTIQKLTYTKSNIDFPICINIFLFSTLSTYVQTVYTRSTINSHKYKNTRFSTYVGLRVVMLNGPLKQELNHFVEIAGIFPQIMGHKAELL